MDTACPYLHTSNRIAVNLRTHRPLEKGSLARSHLVNPNQSANRHQDRDGSRICRYTELVHPCGLVLLHGRTNESLELGRSLSPIVASLDNGYRSGEANGVVWSSVASSMTAWSASGSMSRPMARHVTGQGRT